MGGILVSPGMSVPWTALEVRQGRVQKGFPHTPFLCLFLFLFLYLYHIYLSLCLFLYLYRVFWVSLKTEKTEWVNWGCSGHEKAPAKGEGLELEAGLEPATYALRVRRSTD